MTPLTETAALLLRAADGPDGLRNTQAERKRLGLDEATSVASRLARLVELGYLARSGDRREYVFRLTPAGAAALAEGVVRTPSAGTRSLAGRVREFFRANDDEELTYLDMAIKFSATTDACREAVKHLRLRGLDLESVHLVRMRRRAVRGVA